MMVMGLCFDGRLYESVGGWSGASRAPLSLESASGADGMLSIEWHGVGGKLF